MNFNEYRKRKFIDKTCEHHPDCQLFLITLPGLGEVEHCEDCAREAVLKQEDNLNRSSAIDSKLADTYAVLERDSIVSDKLKAKSLDNYKTDAEIDQKAVNYAKRMEQFYRQDRKGNTIVTGPSGVGKSHLTYGLAKFMNEQFKAYNNPKSVLFVSVVSLFNKIEESFNVDNGFSKAKMVELLTRVDYLFLDDLGKESRKDGNKAKNEWRHSILYEILDNRTNTIINTNLNSAEIKSLYADDFGNGALSSRILEGVTGNSFVYPKGTEDRRY
ncbi:ATP-binding protein [Streptococcus pluranimalium]|uniref:ATP-binding protein n=1 Tax=Streptococcus pluranimalium TaxID=82348 RepID=UPI002A774F5F|nr:ATP-binding protein [Streptococcus pluranimalium]